MKKKITIHLLGDSLVTAYGKDENNFIGGWGDHLGSFLIQSLCRWTIMHRAAEVPEVFE